MTAEHSGQWKERAQNKAMPTRPRSANIFLLLAVVVSGCSEDRPRPDTAEALKVGHVGHDHHLALYVALDNADRYTDETEISIKTVQDRKLYELRVGQRKVADLQIVKVGGGAKMPTALAQRVIDVGLGGVAPVLAACDRGAPVKLIAPLHSKGDMLIVQPDLPVDDWQGFVDRVELEREGGKIWYTFPFDNPKGECND